MTTLSTASNNGATHRPGIANQHKPFSDEVKAAAVERVEHGEATWAVALSLKAHDAQIRDWCKRAGVSAPPPVHDEPFIKAAVARAKAGESATAITLSLGIGRETLKKWIAGKSTHTRVTKTRPSVTAAPTPARKVKAMPKALEGHRRTFDEAYKAAAVAQVTGSLSAAQVAHNLDLVPSVLQRWIRESKTPKLPKDEKALIKKTVATVIGNAAFTIGATGRRRFTQEAKAAAVERWNAGESHQVLMRELKIGSGALSAWRKELAAKTLTKRKYEKRAATPGVDPAMPMASAIAVRDATTYLKHAKNDLYALLGSGAIKEFEEYHLMIFAALKRLQSVA